MMLRSLLLSLTVMTVATSVSAEPERQQILDGKTYTVVTPVTVEPGDAGLTSYIRFPNLTSQPATTQVAIVDSKGRNYGSTTVTSPPFSSPQLTVTQLFQATGGNLNALLADYVTPSIYVRNSASLAGVQHIVYNRLNGFFENFSVCALEPNVDYSQLGQWAINVHTSRITNYPSIVLVHNITTSTKSYRVSVYAAETGVLKGEYNIDVGPNESYQMDDTRGPDFFQNRVNWTPAANEFHANIKITQLSGNFDAVVTHLVTNRIQSTAVNMTTFCKITR